MYLDRVEANWVLITSCFNIIAHNFDNRLLTELIYLTCLNIDLNTTWTIGKTAHNVQFLLCSPTALTFHLLQSRLDTGKDFLTYRTIVVASISDD